MDITYDLIIKYLVKKDNKNTFITQKNIYTYASVFPDKFKNLLSEKFFNCGVTFNDSDNNNISFWSSVLTVLDKKFIIPVENDEIEIINQFKNQLLEKYKKSNLSSFLKEFDKNDFREMFKIIPNNNCIQYLVDTVDINILIFNFDTNNISAFYKTDKMNLWKQTVILATSNNYYKPIMHINSKGEIERLFDYNNLIFKKIITTESIESYNKEFNYIDNINDVVMIEKKKLNVPDEIKEIKIDDNIKGMSKYKMSKMKINELLELTTKLNIEIPKKTTKPVIIDMIIQKVNL
jgi:hypothetical protein